MYRGNMSICQYKYYSTVKNLSTWLSSCYLFVSKCTTQLTFYSIFLNILFYIILFLEY